MSRFTQCVRRWLKMGARIVVDPRAEAEWRRVLRERERRREQQEHDELLRDLDRISRRW